MMKFSKNMRPPNLRQGFTFTLAIVVLAITLFALASFAKNWRKSQQASFTEILPTDSMRLQERISQGFSQIVQSNANIEFDSESATLSISTQKPFKREGQPIADVREFSSSLPYNLRNTGFEAILDANTLGNNSPIVITSNNGSLINSNDGAYDITSFYHPIGFVPEEIRATIVCNRQASNIGELQVLGSAPSGPNLIYYIINYSEPSGKSFLRSYVVPENSNVSMKITYPDNALIYFDSYFSPSLLQNRTSIHYTKSSSGALILPFNQNASSVLRDYSIFRENVSLAEGSNAPSFNPKCEKVGSCYTFNNRSSVFVAGGVKLTNSEIAFPLGEEKIPDPWFEIFENQPLLDDGSSDSWFYWKVFNSNEYNLFEASSQQALSGVSLHIANPVGSNPEAFIQTIANRVSPSTSYAFSFWSKGAPARYKLVLSDGSCLRSSGEWSADACGDFLYSLPSGKYTQTFKEFMTPPTLQALYVRFYPSTDSVYYDGVSLKQSSGMNGGFEDYYPESSTVGPPT